MIVNINWSTGKACIDLDLFFPTTQARAKKLFELMRMDINDFEDVRQWLENITNQHADRVSLLRNKLEEHTAANFEHGLWQGDCVRNENIAKDLQKEISQSEKTAEQYKKYLILFDKVLR